MIAGTDIAIPLPAGAAPISSRAPDAARRI